MQYSNLYEYGHNSTNTNLTQKMYWPLQSMLEMASFENGIFIKCYILVKIFFGREVGGCLWLSVQGTVKLDALKAFDRVSQHRQYDPRLFLAFAHIFHLTYIPGHWQAVYITF